MRSACAASFLVNGDRLSVVTAVPNGRGVKQAASDPVSSREACGSTGVFEAALMRALSDSGGGFEKSEAEYPYEEARQMLDGLGWTRGVRLLTGRLPFVLKLAIASGACSYLPEYVPAAQTPAGKWVWLDQLGPIYRTIDGREASSGDEARHVSDMSVAILHQDTEDFPDMAAELRWEIRRLAGDRVIVDRYRGSEFTANATIRTEKLFEVFRKHRAVVFLGHLASGSGGSGWMLSANNVLTMRELGRFLGCGKSALLPVPELVFAGCCYSAGHDRSSRGKRGLSYPLLFLNAGVRFFVGTSRDVVCSDPGILRSLAVEFIVRWSAAPGSAVSHLYEAKKAIRFPVVSGLYQIYAAGDETEDDSAAAEASLEERFSSIAGLSYVPVSRLPEPHNIGLAQPLEDQLADWVEDIRRHRALARRALVRGSAGSGKTSIAQNVAARLERPMARLDPRSCIRASSRPGEQAIGDALEMIGTLHECVVLIDDLHRFLRSPELSTGAEETLIRWLKDPPPDSVIVVTADAGCRLPSQWRKRIDREFSLPSAANNAAQRQAVFAAVLRQHGLDSLASDARFAAHLAEGTNAPGVYSTQISSAADISKWVSETISLHGVDGNPASAAFWRSAIESQSSVDK